MSEGDRENRAAVARAISDRARELGWRQRELAERSHGSAAAVRELRGTPSITRGSARGMPRLTVIDHACDD